MNTEDKPKREPVGSLFGGLKTSKYFLTIMDEYALYADDEAHSQHEERFKVIGFSERARLLMVCHCYRNGDSLIRIISARKADKKERELYQGGK